MKNAIYLIVINAIMKVKIKFVKNVFQDFNLKIKHVLNVNGYLNQKVRLAKFVQMIKQI